jgi:hypothetical protein
MLLVIKNIGVLYFKFHFTFLSVGKYFNLELITVILRDID